MKNAQTLYFSKGGKKNTEATLQAARQRAIVLKPDAVVIASTTGWTALEAARIFAGTGVRIIAVPFQKHMWARYKGLDPQLASECRNLGVEFLPDEPIVSILDIERPDIVADWRTFSQGFKVALQLASMCVDTGLLSPGSHIISIGGTVNGADTAVALETYDFANILKTNVTEMIAIPSKKGNLKFCQDVY